MVCGWRQSMMMIIFVDGLINVGEILEMSTRCGLKTRYLWRLMNGLKVVLGSPVQSGFSSIFDKTETATGPPCPGYSKKLDRTVIDRSTAVFLRFSAVTRLVSN